MVKRKYWAKVDLSNIKKSGKNYSWKDSIGAIIPFDLDNGGLVGELKLVNHKRSDTSKLYYLYFEYNGHMLRPITPHCFIRGRIQSILEDYYIKWDYEIGDLLGLNKDIEVLDRKQKLEHNGRFRRYYKIRCLTCGFDGGCHYKNDEYRTEYWCEYTNLKAMKRCPCCNSKIVVTGINDFNTLKPDLLKYLATPEDGKKLAAYSTRLVEVKCPDCGRTKIIKLDNISCKNGIACICSDNVFYPNKLAHSLFYYLIEQNKIDKYEPEYSPDWACKYSYDNFIVVNNCSYIVEMDGGLGHGKKTYYGKKDTIGLKRDKIKDNLAKMHGIHVIRIDCEKSDLNYIKTNIVNSILNKIIDFSCVDWNYVGAEAERNINKKICDDFTNLHLTINDLIDKYHFSYSTIRHILKNGENFGWCHIKTKDEEYNERKMLILQYCKDHMYYSALEIHNTLSIPLNVVYDILYDLKSNGVINYDKDIYFHDKKKKISTPVFIYDLNGCLIKKYDSINECQRESRNDFGVTFYRSVIVRKNKDGTDYHGYKVKLLI